MVYKSFLAGALALAMAVAPAAAEPSYKRLTPLLVDLPGFEGGKADGMTISVGDEGMTTASRSYKNEPASIDVAVMSGPMSVGPLASIAGVLQVETSAGHVISGEIDGFKVMQTYNSGDKSGALVIGLSKHAVMTFGYHSLSEDDAVALARKLDWKAIAAAVAE